MRKRSCATLFAIAALANAMPASALVCYVLNATGTSVLRFDCATPSTLQVLNTGPLAAGESFVGIDFRTATRTLYGISTSSRLYSIDFVTGTNTPIGPGPFTPALNGTVFGVDFNPVPDRVRVLSDANQNLRLNPALGTVSAVDPALAYAAADPNAGVDPFVVAVAYSNNFPGATATTVYDIDLATDALVIQNVPNEGTLNTVGPLGFNAQGSGGFDIVRDRDGSETALAMLSSNGTSMSLYRINLATGAATLIGPIGAPGLLRGLALRDEDPVDAMLTTTTQVRTFRLAEPGTMLSTYAPTTVDVGEVLLGVDWRASSQSMIALGSGSRLYDVPFAGPTSAIVIAPFSPALSGISFGFDVNPMVDRARVVSNTSQNLALNPVTATVASNDTAVQYAAGDPNAGQLPSVVGSAYTNSYRGATATTLFAIDSALDVLAVQSPPNNGTLTTVGALGIDIGLDSAFDILTVGDRQIGYLVANPGAASFWTLYTVNLATGAATAVGRVDITPSTPNVLAFAVKQQTMIVAGFE